MTSVVATSDWSDEMISTAAKPTNAATAAAATTAGHLRFG